jgi:hypothetical protein
MPRHYILKGQQQITDGATVLFTCPLIHSSTLSSLITHVHVQVSSQKLNLSILNVLYCSTGIWYVVKLLRYLILFQALRLKQYYNMADNRAIPAV